MSRGRGVAFGASHRTQKSNDEYAQDFYSRDTGNRNYGGSGGQSRNEYHNHHPYRDEVPPRSRFDTNPSTYGGSGNSYPAQRGGLRMDERQYGGYSRGNSQTIYGRDDRSRSQNYGNLPNSGRDGFSSNRGVPNQYEYGNNSSGQDRYRTFERTRRPDEYGDRREDFRGSRNDESSGRSPSYRDSAPRGSYSTQRNEDYSTPRSRDYGSQRNEDYSTPRNSGYGSSRGGGLGSGSLDGSRYDQKTSEENGFRAPRDYKPAAREVQDIFNEDREIAVRDGRMDEDADIVVSEVSHDDIGFYETWEEMYLCPSLMKNIEKSGYRRPRKVQQYTIPFIFDNYDCKVQCETGSGKTATFLIPIIEFLVKHKEKGYNPPTSSPMALVVAPTRELVNQLYDQAKKFVSDTGITVARVYGEYNMRENLQEIRRGCNIVIGCLGRLMHFVQEGNINLGSVRYIVLDEADRLMLENSNQEIIQLLRWRTLPPKDKRQTMLFSATLEDKSVMELAKQFLRSRVVQITAKVTSNRRLQYEIYSVPDSANKYREILEYIGRIWNEREKPRVLIFVNKIVDTDRVAAKLTIGGFNSTTIHGKRGQHLREEAMEDFRSGKARILVATDVCARGVDIKELDYVINFDLPNDISTFIQRCGRTGRTHKGTAVSFYCESENKFMAKGIIKIIENAQQEVPQFLLKEVFPSNYANHGGYQNGTQNSENQNNFNSDDVTNDMNEIHINDKDPENGWD
ncbi:hypothetical protein FO519_003830 [Halicephalobus sp. NKZ332]|nr:hypothetical protein FO519_003830 [Halicephalobus sp. NKZ332]